MKKNKGKETEHIIKEIAPGSIAEEMEIEPGDILLAINGEAVRDVFDYRYLIKDEYIEVLIRKACGEEWILEIDKEYDDDLGIVFENDLMSRYKSCSNKCIFCFIDQMPPGMRDNLYFKDDDSRLSFLQGNYITLTNMDDEDIARIIKMQLAPINISVQTTNPQLRSKMLHNRFAGEKLRYLDRLYEGHVEMNGQVVLCRGVNDGDELRRTIEDLSRYLPFMRSVSVVPAGITRYREGLCPITLFTKEEAGAVIDLIESFQPAFYAQYGLHFVHASDEWYFLAERELPPQDRYDGYIQLENGVGMMRLLTTEFEETLQRILRRDEYPRQREQVKRTLTIATGKLAYETMRGLAGRMMEAFPLLKIHVQAIRNDFFGETITVSGLITAQDLIAQLSESRAAGKELGDTLLIPANMVCSKEGAFLDDYTLEQVEQALSMKLTVVGSKGEDLIAALLHPDYNKEKSSGGFVYGRAYE